MQTDLIRIYVLWDRASASAERAANLIARHFDGIGMERDGVSFQVPVRFRSEPWSPDGPPRPIDLSQTEHNVVILLNDAEMYENINMWNSYVAAIRDRMSARGGADIYIPFGSPTRTPPLPYDSALNTQYARRDLWHSLANDQAREQRLLLHTVFAIREAFRRYAGRTAPEPLFVSHAKVDGDSTAKAIVQYVNSTDHDVPINTFYDATELLPGENFESRFEEEIGRGTLLAIVSDAYDSRPWCVYELTIAKRNRRPIVLADVGKVRVNRTYPYGANLPKLRIDVTSTPASWIEALLVQTLSEGLRCDLSVEKAVRALRATPSDRFLVLPRPPELFDIIGLDGPAPSHVVYPDPPLGKMESELLAKAAFLTGSSIQFHTIGELM